MAPTSNNSIQYMNVIVRLGMIPRFEIHAGTNPLAISSEAEFHRTAAGAEHLDLLHEVLEKIRNAYPQNQEAITLCVENDRLLEDEACT